MKRIISWVLLMVTLLSLFAGCGKNTSADPTDAPEVASTEAVVADENLENAIEYLKTFYKEVRDGDQTPSDFERLGSVRVGLTAYEVAYTVDCDESAVKIVRGDSGMVTIDVNEDSEVEVPYALTATVTGTDGRTASLVWNHVLPISMNGRGAEIVDAAYALEEGEALPYEVTLTGEIISVDTPYSADYKNITVSIKVTGREDKPIMCYRLKGEGCEDLLPGDIITVTGTIKNYKGTIEFDAGCMLIKAEKSENSVEILTDPQEILEAAYKLDYGQSLPYPATLTGRVVGYDTKYSAQYGNVTVTIKTGEPWYYIKCYRMKGEGVDQVFLDDVITVTGYLKNYNGTIEFDAGCIMDSWTDNPDPVAPSDPNEILDQAQALRHRNTLPYPCTLSGTITKIVTKWSDKYGNITVNMTVDGTDGRTIQCFRMEGGEEAKTLRVGDHISVYGWVMKYNSTIEFKQGCDLVKVNSKVPVPEKPATLKEQLAEAAKLSNGSYTGYESSVQGSIVTTPEYSSRYDNWTFEVKDSETGLDVKCYGLGTGMKLYLGDVVKIEGELTAYNGTPQFDYNSKLTLIESNGSSDDSGDDEGGDTEVGPDSTLAEVVAAAKKLSASQYLTFDYTVTGTVYAAYNLNSDGTRNIGINISTGDGINCNYTKGDVEDVAVGDTITVTGKLGMNKKSKLTFNGCTLDSHVAAPKVEEPESGTLTCAAASELGKKFASGVYSTNVYTITGTVITDPDTAKGTMTIADSTGSLYVYGIDAWSGISDKPVNGDTVVLKGVVGNYNGSPQMKYPTLVSVTHKACEHTNKVDSVIKEATCGATGLKNIVCDDCKEIVEEDVVIEATGNHSYVDGVCTGCGAEETTDEGDDNTEGGTSEGDGNTGDGTNTDSNGTTCNHQYDDNGICDLCGDDKNTEED